MQKELGTLIMTLLSLQQVMERHKGLATSLKRDKYSIRDVQLKQELRDCVRTSLYKLCTSYGDSLKSIPLPNEDMVKNLLSYKQSLEI